MAEVLTVGQVARQLKVPPWKLSNLFYRGRLDDVKCPIVAGRRQIPASYLPQIAAMLRTAGYAVQSPAGE